MLAVINQDSLSLSSTVLHLFCPFLEKQDVMLHSQEPTW